MTRYLGSVPSQAWSPLDLGADLTAWYDADVATSVTSDANGVSQWDDRSGNGYHATQATNASKPSFASSRVSFDGGDWLDASVSIATLSRCVALVGRDSTSSGSFVGQQSADGGWVFGWRLPDASNTRLFIAKANISYIGEMANVAKATADADRILLGNTTATTWRMSRDGNAETGTHSVTLDSGRLMRIGSEEGGRRITGSIREMVVASSLSAANQERLEGYLAWKWGMVGNLPAGHAYKSQKP